MRGRFAKALHVSPLMGMDHALRLAPDASPRERLSVHIESPAPSGARGVRRDAGAAPPRDRRAASCAALTRALPAARRCGCTARIYRHALRLQAARRARHIPHPSGEAARDAHRHRPRALATARAAGDAHRSIAWPADRAGLLAHARRRARDRRGRERVGFGERAPSARCRRVLRCARRASTAQLLRGSVGLGESYVRRPVGLRRPRRADAHRGAQRAPAGRAARARSRRVLIPVQRWARWLARNTPGRARERSPPTTTSATSCSRCSSTRR